jgi:hypothetical protein
VPFTLCTATQVRTKESIRTWLLHSAPFVRQPQMEIARPRCQNILATRQRLIDRSPNYSHMDGGVMDGRWRSVGGDGDEDLLRIPVPGGCQNRVSGSESRFLMAAAQRKSIWEKRRLPDIMSSGGICTREGRSRGVPGPPHAGVAWPGLGRATTV